MIKDTVTAKTFMLATINPVLFSTFSYRRVEAKL